MTLYLLDENVLKEMRPGGNAEVAEWLKTVPDSDLRISAVTFFEKRKGWENHRKKDPVRAQQGLDAIDALEKLYTGRTVAIGAPEAAEWARLMGAKGKNLMDLALVATANINDMVLVTRNTKDMVGRDVRVLDPFKVNPKITLV